MNFYHKLLLRQFLSEIEPASLLIGAHYHSDESSNLSDGGVLRNLVGFGGRGLGRG